MSQYVSAVVVGADRLGNIPELLKGHNIAIRHHISGRDPSHQKKTLQLPSGTELLILLTDFLGHNVMKTFRAAAQRAGIRVLACRRSVCSMKQALNQCGYCEACDAKLSASEPQVKFAATDRRGARPRVRAA
ncbi:DUF2325 domain-containing protein [Pollutimonas harenae]|uniref:DUF2325 domain-containing protein n=1 Tax=Pollutimonas harenae TaxID=657015 RepID=A0A853H2V3_9BURK|nr:DUF2325 domain-containing protein [Pollutimonas harenae]NYT85555.1 DUF2325 domain-containing protein [Pollutimonas harenae]TEA70640.1 DUF2325 domain-containing protein [Pollutimonas harenae]